MRRRIVIGNWKLHGDRAFAHRLVDAIAAVHALARDPDAVIGAFPADHHIGDPVAFVVAVERAFATAERDDVIVTIGIAPTRPDTGFGYLELGDGEVAPGVRPVARFVEKPAQAVAEQYLAGGRHLWNGGMFFVRAARLLAELDRFVPATGVAMRAIAAALASGDAPPWSTLVGDLARDRADGQRVVAHQAVAQRAGAVDHQHVGQAADAVGLGHRRHAVADVDGAHDDARIAGDRLAQVGVDHRAAAAPVGAEVDDVDHARHQRRLDVDQLARLVEGQELRRRRRGGRGGAGAARGQHDREGQRAGHRSSQTTARSSASASGPSPTSTTGSTASAPPLTRSLASIRGMRSTSIVTSQAAIAPPPGGSPAIR